MLPTELRNGFLFFSFYLQAILSCSTFPGLPKRSCVVHFHQLILGNVSCAVLLLVIRFLNDLKIAQYETFPSSLFWRRTEGELTLFCFTGARSRTVFRCSRAGTSYWCWQRQCDKPSWSRGSRRPVALLEPLAVLAAVSVQDTMGLDV